MNRHRVDHFVRDDRAADTLGKPLEPLHAVSQACLLSQPQLGAQLEDAVVEIVLCQQRLCQRAAAGAELEHRAAERSQLPRERAPEERSELRRGDEVAGGAELARAGGVVAQARLVQRDFHVAGERDPSLVAADLIAQTGQHRVNLT